ncbi:MAG: phosphoribosylaminoimidazolesuccinocarboxamide synthase [Thermoanaerobaculum sp.]|nr:phosphoribosylaminoimidazolesuccinocarboxamide synthase [Thermoanaerobaculum sp.]
MVRQPYEAPSSLQPYLLRQGKVRDIYGAPEGGLVLVATDRISAFDVVLSPGIPGKGVVLTQLSNFWFARFAHLVPNHLLATSREQLGSPFATEPALEGRAVRVRQLRMVPVECVVRGYLVGTGWKEYQATGAVCGIPLPGGLRLAEELPEPIFTPSTKEDTGHDQNISFDRVVELVGGPLAERLRDLSLRIYREAASYARQRGVIIADTKFEFGLDEHGELVWADEALTPDSSRFWPVESYQPGANPPSFDKQFVRDFLEAVGWDKNPPAPPLPEDVVAGTQARYLEAYKKLTGHELKV